jgi:DNA helicase-2/ATP-dependent DNA helicase PcrA
MIIAGAGSGKTRVLTYRIAHLLQKGVDPFNILSLTFTNKAAKEMRERINELIGAEARNVWMGTFHSVFSRILRSEAEKLGYPSNFTIYDTADAKNLIKTILKEQGIDDKVYKPGLVLSRISSAKNNLITPGAYQKNTTIYTDDQASGKPKIGMVYEIYAKRCFKAGAMDFDDLLLNTNILLKRFPECLHKYQHQFKYLLVDEYQDTNYSQYLIIKKLAALNENICVVGDDAQSIYAFRGANIQNILNFEKDYPDSQLFRLEQNYRSSQNIVNAANNIISKNKDQIKKTVWTDNSVGDKIEVVGNPTENDEGKFVANSIFDTQYQEKLQNKDFAILYRTNAQSRAFEEALRKKNIPYRIYGGLSFYQRKEIKDLLSYFRLIINPKDEEALKRIINYPARGIGKTTVDKIVIAANHHDLPMWEVIANLGLYNIGVNAGTYTKIQAFAAMIQSFASQLHKKEAYDMAKEIAGVSGVLKELYTDKTPEGISRHENIQEILNAIKDFSERAQQEAPDKHCGLEQFMQDVALLTNEEVSDDKDNNKVSLMTIHAAKGLEYPYVYVVGMEENLFPSQLSLGNRQELEEERRLFYVAVTRAERKATLSYASQRYKWGNLIHSEPSRFIEELDERYVDIKSGLKKERSSLRTKDDDGNRAPKINVGTPNRNLKKVTNTTVSSGPSAADLNINAGQEVEHAKFGKGKVLTIEGGKATIFFKSVGQKQLLLKFAKLKLI